MRPESGGGVAEAPAERENFSRGILTRGIKAQLVAFVIITLVGIAYVSANYVGLTKTVFGSDGCTVHADFPDSGGIFTNAEVTYRGVTVGKVGALHLIDNGVRVDLLLDNCGSPHIPASTAALVSDRSVIGEQYVNLVPPNGNGPYLRADEVIPMSRNSVPTSVKVLLTNLDALVQSVDLKALHTTIAELGKAFNGKGPDLGQLLDATNNLLTAAAQNLPQTIALLSSASTVLRTQLDENSSLAGFTHSLNLLSAQLRSSDPVIRNLLDQGPADLGVIRSFVVDNQTDLGATLANLATTGQLLVRHVDGVEQILELYTQLAAGGLTVIRNNVEALGVILNVNDPPDCGDPTKGSQGYNGTKIREPADVSPQAPNVGAHCTAPVSSGTNVRGSANVPGGDPISTSGAGTVYPRAVTSDTLRVGTGLNSSVLPNDLSWYAVLTNALN